VFALILYIIPGSIVLRRGKTAAIRAGACAGALPVPGYIASEARRHDRRACSAPS
jgi:heme O synthase-like polyprenyltransferase